MPQKIDLLQKWFGTDSAEEAFGKVFGPNKPRIYEPPLESCIKAHWPYYAPADSLPAPLPTMEDIEKVRLTEKDLTKGKLGLGDGHVFRVNNVFAVKFSPTRHVMREMENMLFVEQNSNVRIPKLYAAYTAHGDPLGYTSDNRQRWMGPKRTREELPPYHFLVMEYIEGSHLRKQWQVLETDQKKKICMKLGEHLRSLRAIPSPGYYGRPHYQPFHERSNLVATTFQAPHGPYDTYSEMATVIADAFEYRVTASNTDQEYKPRVQLILDNLRASLTKCENVEPKFSHLDLQFENIILKPIDSDEDRKAQDHEVVLIDWTTAAWCPAWVVLGQVLVDSSL
ncbi:MAG: hypothetical protein M1820_000962 [Bogoriella megaspora]|nr:MAG: hypothetical protein M1820_000962 [Bogoriella megaspora]